MQFTWNKHTNTHTPQAKTCRQTRGLPPPPSQTCEPGAGRRWECPDSRASILPIQPPRGCTAEPGSRQEVERTGRGNGEERQTRECQQCAEKEKASVWLIREGDTHPKHDCCKIKGGQKMREREIRCEQCLKQIWQKKNRRTNNIKASIQNSDCNGSHLLSLQ